MMNLSGSCVLKFDEFYFGTQFFCRQAGFIETLILFKQVDQEHKGYLDVKNLEFLVPNSTKDLERQLTCEMNKPCDKNTLIRH